MEMAGSIEMWLVLDGDRSAWSLCNARLIYKSHAQRMLFDAALPLRDVLVPAVAECLLDYLGSVQETAVFSNRDLRIEMDGLRVEGLRVLTRFDSAGNATASIRFLSTDGDMSAIFQQDFRASGPEPSDVPALRDARAAPQVEDVTMPVLNDLLCPALEVFDHILENGLSEDNAKVLAARVKTMRSKRDELSDYVSLLSSFVSASDEIRARPSAADERPDWRRKMTTRHPLAVRNVSWDPTGGFQRGEEAPVPEPRRPRSEAEH